MSLTNGYLHLTQADQLYVTTLQAQIEDLQEQLRSLQRERQQLLRKGQLRRFRAQRRDQAAASSRS